LSKEAGERLLFTFDDTNCKVMRALFVHLFICCSVVAIGQTKKAVADKIVAVVGNRIVLESEIKGELDEVERMGKMLLKEEKCRIVSQAVITKVLAQQAEKDSLPVTDEQVQLQMDQWLYSMTRHPRDGDDSGEEHFRKMLESSRQSIKEHLLANAMHDKILSNVKITPAEVQAWFNKLPAGSISFVETQLEVGQLIIYPQTSRAIEEYIKGELINFKRQIEVKLATFQQLASKYSQSSPDPYLIRRDDKAWDESLRTVIFRLKEGEISDPIKITNGYCIVNLVERRGNEARVQMIFRIPPVTNADLNQSMARLDTVHSLISAGVLNFKDAVVRYSNDDASRYYSPFLSGARGSSYVTFDELDKEQAAILIKMQPGEFSKPMLFTNDPGRKGVRIIYLKSKIPRHQMNLKDDYERIADMALESKKAEVLRNWYRTHLVAYDIELDKDLEVQCEDLLQHVHVR
jgi:peptidyl-prolyl cis-trans isomerase SurA